LTQAATLAGAPAAGGAGACGRSLARQQRRDLLAQGLQVPGLRDEALGPDCEGIALGLILCARGHDGDAGIGRRRIGFELGTDFAAVQFRHLQVEHGDAAMGGSGQVQGGLPVRGHRDIGPQGFQLCIWSSLSVGVAGAHELIPAQAPLTTASLPRLSGPP
jgi:hypothetical protein